MSRDALQKLPPQARIAAAVLAVVAAVVFALLALYLSRTLAQPSSPADKDLVHSGQSINDNDNEDDKHSGSVSSANEDARPASLASSNRTAHLERPSEERATAAPQYSDTEFFLTARSSVGTSRIAWSFYASAMGSWVVYTIPAFVCDRDYGAGIVGLVVFALFAGLPLVIVAYAGKIVRQMYPGTLSWGHFAHQRFGKATQLYVSLLVLFNMAISLTAEYTAIGSLFHDILGFPPYFPVLLNGILAMGYTVVGGLYVSIITDRWQSLFSLVLLAIAFIYVAATFRPHLGELPPYLGPNTRGYESIITIGVGITCASFFSDAIWQRVWASADERTLRRGSIFGCCLAIVVAFLFGLGGFFAVWAGYAEPSQASTSFFRLFDMSVTSGRAVVVLVVLVAVTMNESSVDTFQNALTDSFVATVMSFGVKSVPLWATRLVVASLNIPLMILGAQRYNITSLYLITNVLVTTSTTPLLLGLYPKWQKFLLGRHCLMGCIGGLLSAMVTSTIMAGSFRHGLYQYFYAEYAWQTFASTIIGSTVITIATASIERIFRKKTARYVAIKTSS